MSHSLTSYRSPKTEVRTGAIAGTGIFARELIAEGELIAVKSGHSMTKAEFDLLDDDCKSFCLQIEDDSFIGPMHPEEIALSAVFINHSCDPNVGFMSQVSYVAMRDIMPGEELTHDYAMAFQAMDHISCWECACGSELCRKRITETDWLDPSLQNRYIGHFSTYIAAKIAQRS